MKLNFIFILFLHILNQTSSQIIELKPGVELKEEVDKNKFYKVELTDRTSDYLIVYAKPSDRYISDPDIFISLKNSYPSNELSSDWYTVKSEENVIVIENKNLEDSKFIFIGIKCASLCNYRISAYYSNEIKLYESEHLEFRFTDQKTKIFSYKHNNKDFARFQYYLNSHMNNDITVKMHFISASNQAKEIPMLTVPYLGYSADIDTKNFMDCAQCYFKIEVSSKLNAYIAMGIKVKDALLDMNEEKEIISSLTGQEIDCYNMTFLKKKDTAYGDNDWFVLNLNSFQEKATLMLVPNNLIEEGGKISRSKLEGRATNYHTENTLINRFNYLELRDSFLCVIPSKNNLITYSISLLKEDAYNAKFSIIPGLSQHHFLPKNNVGTYSYSKINDATFKNININLKVISGNPILYAYVCSIYKNCKDFTPQSVEFMYKVKELFSSPLINDGYNINIPNEKNTCMSNENLALMKAECYTAGIVYCKGEEPCQFKISMNTDQDFIFLQKRLKFSKYVGKQSHDHFKIINNDETIEKLIVVLNSHSGDADLYGSKQYKHAEEDPARIASNFDKLRDIIVFERDSVNNKTLAGEYFISVEGYTYSYYTIYYYTSHTSSITDLEKVIESGIIYPEVIDNKSEIKVFKFVNRGINKNTPYIISFNTLNCDGEAYQLNPKKDVIAPMLGGVQNYYFVMKSENKLYKDLDAYRFGFNATQLKKSNFNSTAFECKIFASGLEEGRELLLNEGFPHTMTLGKELTKSFHYIYSHSNPKESCIVSIYFEEASNIKLRLRIGDSEEEISYNVYTSFKSHLFEIEKLQKSCPLENQCYIHISIEHTGEEPVTYRIMAKSNSNKPIELENGKILQDAITPMTYQYYISPILKKEVGRLTLNSGEGNLILVGKVYGVKSLDDLRPEVYNIKLPRIENNSKNNLSFNPNTMTMDITEAQTSKCEQYCMVLIGVYSYNKFSSKSYLTDYSIEYRSNDTLSLIKLDSITPVYIERHDELKYYQVIITKDYDTLFFDLISSVDVSGDIFINFGENKPTRTTNDFQFIGKSHSSLELTNSLFTTKSIKNLKNSIFTIAIGVSAGKNLAFNLKISGSKNGVRPISEISTLSPQHCEINFEDDYCDFILVSKDINKETILIYASLISKIEEIPDSLTIYATPLNVTDLESIKNQEMLRPRKDKFEFSSQLGMNNELLVYTNTKEADILVISVSSKKKGSYSILTSIENKNEGNVQKPRLNTDYLFSSRFGTQTHLSIDATKSNYMAKISRIYGEGSIVFNNQKTFHFTNNMENIHIALDQVKADFTIIAKGSNNLAVIIRYDIKLNHNLDLVKIGKTNHIFYPDNKLEFPFSYYIPLVNISNSLTVNVKLVDVDYGKFSDDEIEIDQYEIDGILMEKIEYDRAKSLAHNEKSYDYFKGTFDAALKIGRVTLPANSANGYAVINLRQANLNRNKPKSFLIQILAFPENSLDLNIHLPQNNYFFSLLTKTNLEVTQEKVIHSHVYKLKRGNNNKNDKFMIIELSKCSGGVFFYIKEKITKEDQNSLTTNTLNFTENYIQDYINASYEHYGKTIIEINLDDDKEDPKLIICAKDFTNKLCNFVANEFKCEEGLINFSIRYRTFVSREDFDKYKLPNMGLVSYSIPHNTNDVVVNFEQPHSSLPKNSAPLTSAYYFRLYMNPNPNLENYYSTCLSQNSQKLYRSHTANVFTIKDFPTNNNYVVSLLVGVKETNDTESLLVYTPIQVHFNTQPTISIGLTGKILLYVIYM